MCARVPVCVCARTRSCMATPCCVCTDERFTAAKLHTPTHTHKKNKKQNKIPLKSVLDTGTTTTAATKGGGGES